MICIIILHDKTTYLLQDDPPNPFLGDIALVKEFWGSIYSLTKIVRAHKISDEPGAFKSLTSPVVNI